MKAFRDAARFTTGFLVRGLAGSLPPGLSLISPQGTDLVIEAGDAEVIQCMDLALVDPPEDADEYAGLVHVALDSIQTVVARVTTNPWPSSTEGTRIVNAYSAVRGEAVVAGYGTLDNPLLALSPLPLADILGGESR